LTGLIPAVRAVRPLGPQRQFRRRRGGLRGHPHRGRLQVLHQFRRRVTLSHTHPARRYYAEERHVLASTPAAHNAAVHRMFRKGCSRWSLSPPQRPQTDALPPRQLPGLHGREADHLQPRPARTDREMHHRRCHQGGAPFAVPTFRPLQGLSADRRCAARPRFRSQRGDGEMTDGLRCTGVHPLYPLVLSDLHPPVRCTGRARLHCRHVRGVGRRVLRAHLQARTDCPYNIVCD
jgi:hypothetical protein